MNVTLEEIQRVQAEADCLHSEEDVAAALDQLASALASRFAHDNPLFLCVMTGAVIPVGHLLTRLSFPLELDYVHATRYRGETAGGELHWLAHPRSTLAGRVVVVVDDILDEGFTLAAILDECRAAGASEVYSVAIVDKQHDRRYQNLAADFVGLTVEDRYVFGFGMDYKGYLRNLPAIYALKEEE